MPPIVGRASVIDGDTIEIRGQRIRLFGIDAPEGRQTCTDVSGALPLRAEGRSGPRLPHQRRCGDLQAQGPGSLRPRSSGLPGLRRGPVGLPPLRRAVRPCGGPRQAAQAGMWSGQFVPPWEWRAEARGRTRLSTGENVERPSTPHLSLVKSGMAPSRRHGNMTAVARLAQRSLRFLGAACQSGSSERPPHPYRALVPYPRGVSPRIDYWVTARVSGSGRAERCKFPRLIAVSANSGVSLLGPDTY